MRRIVRWAIHNSPAMNILMIGLLVMGTLSLVNMRREVFPEFELDIVLVSVPYPGASPDEVENGICKRIEESLYAINGIKKMTSVAKEGSGSVVLELLPEADAQKIVNEVRSEVDRIATYFPETSEDPQVQEITMRESAIEVGVLAPESTGQTEERELRDVAEWVREELLNLSEVSEVQLNGARDFQIDIEIDEDTLRKYGLTLQEVAAIVRRENLEMPSGMLRSRGEEVLLRGKNKRFLGREIAELPLVTDPNGVVLTVGDLADVRDQFVDATAINKVNGREALVLTVNRTKSEDLLAMTKAVRDQLEELELPTGYEFEVWGDRSTDVRDRLDMLVNNGIMGLVLVFLVLAAFLELRLAFWVALGIPVSLLGAGSALLFGGQTLNMLSMFAFLMALGIVVDDAIVIGENIYSHRQMGKKFVRATIDGTAEVMPSVIASVTTTIIAFCPLLFVAGIMGKFIAVMPFAVIAMLIISLIESVLILPCHLAHEDNLFLRALAVALRPFYFVVKAFAAINHKVSGWLSLFIDRVYTPTLTWSIRNKAATVATGLALFFIALGFVRSGLVPFVVFPKLDSNYLLAKITFPDGTPATVTDEATTRIEQALWRVNAETEGPPIVKLVHRKVGQITGNGNPARGGGGSGSHVGMVIVELEDTTVREQTSEEITAMWRSKVGIIAGVDSLTYGIPMFGPGGTPIEFKLLAAGEEVRQLEEAIEKCKAKLATYDGVFDVADDSRPGKWELQIRVKDRAKSMGISHAELSETIRAAYYGAEVMRLQRGRHEVKLMVRYPAAQRRSLANFEGMHIRVPNNQPISTLSGRGDRAGVLGTGSGNNTAAQSAPTDNVLEIPVTELAEIDVVRGYSEINRLDRLRSVTISADVNEAVGNANKVITELREPGGFMDELFAEYPAVKVRWEGQEEQRRESMSSLYRGAVVAIIVMFGLLTLEFRTYLQPLLILAIIPFGIIGAIFGHAVMGLSLTLFSFFGLVALTGVVVNDSIVLIDFINHRVRGGMPVDQALIEAGRRRFRPVLLTSMTTIAGLFPILIESSFQAQILIPMATSLSFGLLLATVVVLIMVPVLCGIYYRLLPPDLGGQGPGDDDPLITDRVDGKELETVGIYSSNEKPSPPLREA
ncbi:MAG: efflux RND transporter permease subunit [Planctomycetota bacterium]|nr:efflux RND transporter permease subunit [Planctomycetota bacterium]